MFWSSACVALVMSGQVLCYSGDRITCSDVVAPGSKIEKCSGQTARVQREWRDCVKAGQCSKDGHTSGVWPPMNAVAR